MRRSRHKDLKALDKEVSLTTSLKQHLRDMLDIKSQISACSRSFLRPKLRANDLSLSISSIQPQRAPWAELRLARDSPCHEHVLNRLKVPLAASCLDFGRQPVFLLKSSAASPVREHCEKRAASSIDIALRQKVRQIKRIISRTGMSPMKGKSEETSAPDGRRKRRRIRLRRRRQQQTSFFEAGETSLIKIYGNCELSRAVSRGTASTTATSLGGIGRQRRGKSVERRLGWLIK